MAYPAYIPTRTISLGGAMVLESAELIKAAVEIKASRPLIWQDTGYRFESISSVVTSEAGKEASFALPRTDVAGWKDARTGDLIDVSAADAYSHRYTATVSFLDASGRGLSIAPYTVGPFVLPAGDGSVVNLGKLVLTSTVAGDTVYVPDSWGAYVAQALALYNAADTAATPSTIAKRDASGRLAVANATAVGEAVTLGQSVARFDAALGALRRDLAAGRSTGLHWTGDSTGDSNGTNSADIRTCERLALAIAAKAPNHHVMMKTWVAGSSEYGPWVAIQSQSAGRKRLTVSGRSVRHITGTNFASGVMDLRVLVSMPSWPSSEVSLLSRQKRATNTNDLQFELLMESGGYLRLRWSTSGAGWNVGNNDSTAAVTVSAGVPIWLRAVGDLSAGTSATTTFYTSSDGVAWTPLGTPVTRSISAPLWVPASDAFFSVGAGAWQPTFQPFTGGSIYEVQIRDGAGGPCIAPASLERWDWYADGSGSQSDWAGAPTVYVTNASISGSSISTHTPLVTKEAQDYGQVVAIFNDSHNEQALLGSLWTAAYQAMVSAVTARLAYAAVGVVLQNPRTTAWPNYYAQDPPHRIRLGQLSAIAPIQHWGVIDVYQAFTDHGLSDLVGPDGLHPTQAGYAMAGAVTAASLGL